jgi:hypothetical protein
MKELGSHLIGFLGGRLLTHDSEGLDFALTDTRSAEDHEIKSHVELFLQRRRFTARWHQRNGTMAVIYDESQKIVGALVITNAFARILVTFHRPPLLQPAT